MMSKRALKDEEKVKTKGKPKKKAGDLTEIEIDEMANKLCLLMRDAVNEDNAANQ